jgi:hypothetical protein
VFYILVSRAVPASALRDEERALLPMAFIGDEWKLRKDFPLERFPTLTGIGHRVESPNGRSPEVSYLSLWIKVDGKWVAVKDDPRTENTVQK